MNDNLNNRKHDLNSLPIWMTRAIETRNRHMSVGLVCTIPYKLTQIDKFLVLVPLTNVVVTCDN